VLVVLAACLLLRHVRGLVETLVHQVLVLAGQLLGLVKEIRHRRSFPLVVAEYGEPLPYPG